MSAPQIQITEKGGMLVTLPAPASSPASIGEERAPEPPSLEAPVSLSTPEPVSGVTLAQLVDELFALEDTLDMVHPDQAQEFIEALQGAAHLTAQKVDATHRFINWCEAHSAMAKLERDRQAQRANALVEIAEACRQYVVRVIQARGKGANGRYPVLHGKAISFGIKRNPPSTEITDQERIAAKHKTITVPMPLETWNALLDDLPLERREMVLTLMKRPTETVSLSSVKDEIVAAVGEPAIDAAIARDEESIATEAVPGARLLIRYSLQRK